MHVLPVAASLRSTTLHPVTNTKHQFRLIRQLHPTPPSLAPSDPPSRLDGLEHGEHARVTSSPARVIRLSQLPLYAHALMVRLSLFRLPTKLRRRVRRNRMATLLILIALVGLLVVPLYTAYCIYKPPRYLISYLRSAFPDVLWEETTNEKIIALSIDDAPSTHTDEIMQVLQENDSHATFFVIGSQVEGRQDKLQKLVHEGHELGNHAMHDEPSRSLSNDILLNEVYTVKEMLTAAYEAEGKILPNNYFRPGSGLFNWRMRDLLGNRGFRITLGSIYPHDPQIPYPDINAKHILSMAHPGGIIICHDRRSWTVPMLRIVLPELKRQGYRIVTITDLVKSVEPLGRQG